MHDQRRAYAYGLVTVVLWSTVASAFKLSLRRLEVPQLLLHASLTSTLALGAILAVQGRLGQALRTPRGACLRALGLGLLNPCLYYLVLFKAYDLLPAQQAQPLNYTWALVLAYLSVPFLGQRLGIREIAAGLISYSGVVVIATRGSVASLQVDQPLGVALALMSTVIWAVYWLCNARAATEPVVGLFLNFLFALPFLALLCHFTSGVVVTDPAGWAGAAYVGLFEMGITFVTWLTALRLSPSSARVANLIFIAPFLSLVFIHYLVGETLHPSTFAGLGLIVAGLAVQQAGARR